MAERKTLGRCLCGDVQYEYLGEPIEAGYCHCESCRRHTSSPFVAFFVVDRERFRYTKGKPISYQSSPGVDRTHCGRCGSPIAFENSNELALWVGTLEDPRDFRPAYHCYVAERLPWVIIADSLPRYAHSSKNATPIGFDGPTETTNYGSG
jgi:hypothetical protein